MSTRTSVRPATQAALASALTAKTELTGVAVHDGLRPSEIRDEIIWIGDVRSVQGGVAYQQAGRKQRKDQFAFDVEIWAWKPGQSTPADAKARGAVMFGALEDLLADDATFNGLQWAQITGYDGPNADPRAEGGGYGAHVVAHVECLSQLI